MLLLILLNTAIFILLSFLHIYWALGGNWGMDAVLPTLSESQRTFKPGIWMKFAVGGLMGVFAMITMGNGDIFPYVDSGYFRYATIVVGVIFALRAMGDFRYMGFFKKATGTLFAKNDTRYYSPLCVLIAAVSFAIAMLPHE
ncbi:MAG: DUF3995 domain-containing protein [Flavobacterium sp.]|nr:MAG: DUF3995 domain-containing protein [Flavobacterium sp.]